MLSLRARVLPQTLLIMAAWVALGACAGRGTAIESGPSECADGMDNDDDGRIDCKDPDCHPLAFCSSSSDIGPNLDGPPPPPPPDKGPTPDLKPPTPDLPPPSSYGKRCEYTQKGIKCEDGQTVCVPGKYGTSGFCTHACSQDQCPPGPNGTKVSCAYTVYYSSQTVHYCLFSCGSTSCPHDTQCFYSNCF